MKKALPFEFGKDNNADVLSQCAVCRNAFSQEDVTVLEEGENRNTFHVSCFKCKSAAIIFLSSNQSGIVSLGMATDLNSQEAGEMIGRSALDSEDVLNAYRAITGHQGNLEKLFENK